MTGVSIGHSLQGKGESRNMLVEDVLDTYSFEADEGAKDKYVYKGISFNLCMYGTASKHGRQCLEFFIQKDKQDYPMNSVECIGPHDYLAYSELLLFFLYTFICFKVHQVSVS